MTTVALPSLDAALCAPTSTIIMSSSGPPAASPSSPEIPEAKSSSTVDVPKPRTLILCFDGTAEQYDGDVRP